MIVLGIETSCDETAVALVTDDRKLLAHELYSQVKAHSRYGGVVPEIAARAHLERLEMLVDAACLKAGISLQGVDVVAATGGPGLIGGVIVGTVAAKALALSLNKPYVAVNHLEAHALMPRFIDDISFPFLLLLVSGGHCQLLLARDVGQYEIMGSTMDDAVGEAFDKVAKKLCLPLPGGPHVEKLAREGDKDAYNLPFPLKGKKEHSLNFSFSGLKTAVLNKIDDPEFGENDMPNLCASFQEVVGQSLEDRSRYALMKLKEDNTDLKGFVVSGGVAANESIRLKLEKMCIDHKIPFFAPPVSLCTDNGVMVAWAGLERFNKGLISPLDFAPRPRWPLSEL